MGDDTNAVIREMIGRISAHGITYQSGEHSMNRDFSIQEVFNAQLCLTDPRKRIFKSALPLFNPGLAAARFIYMLSGSNLLEPIAFYSKSACCFSDDGITIPGSSYGMRIFGGASGKNQFDLASKTISTRSDTKRAVIDLHDASDLARLESQDIPCTLNIAFMPRSDTLHTTVAMRANDAIQLLPYNVFEFSLLQECMSACTGLRLGNYWHTAVSMHIRGENIAKAQKLSRETAESCAMPAISSFSETLRLRLVQEEADIRSKSAHSANAMFDQMSKFWGEYAAVWADILSTLACEAFRLHNKHSATWIQGIARRIIGERSKEAPLTAAYCDFLDHLATPT
ncbi:MAG: hypothetical protein A3A98_01080 [Candidatus Staskawiczbacteria bacterium RIFCSPLOWO2_01_FULL_40_39]|uniref:Thymidylate synthase/dCMP hydroxymethylase domain-containing protein n=1 Tax=Candidatus Staskawiczbacteria bacterium RIFCSPHIGHO2_01_FULL_39_25 TaxID=1802202 RepID=A0A1G2HMV6_9BACT|nr:MAG: hypothetical protein A2730_01080 [Candidatus Staskawiczbacteria bacterium RIFCSPHIGHO2_01_FULL_39_25]OGZ73322.1 MAG: hypothetical protein A3A98_01080 [Candidatus Staskawiczbacteria bacterium RIFCSPLOWO2_01_FULL_40_39]